MQTKYQIGDILYATKVRQVQVLELYCAKAGFNYEVIQDLGSGMNYYKKGLTKLLNLILEGQVKRLVLAHKDRAKVIEAGRFYPSSKTCSVCGNVKQELELSERVYQCNACKSEIDRDFNAALNLANYAQKQIGQVLPELTPADLSALLDDLAINQLATSKVETGMQQKSTIYSIL